MTRLTTTQWVETAEWLLFTGDNILFREPDPLWWIECLVDRVYTDNNAPQGRIKLQGYFWEQMQSPKQLRCLLLLLTRNRRAIGQLINANRGCDSQPPIDNTRQSTMRWMLATCHQLLEGPTKLDYRHYRQVLASLRPTQAQIDDYYRYLCWYLRFTPAQLAGLAELMGATELTDRQVFRMFKQWS